MKFFKFFPIEIDSSESDIMNILLALTQHQITIFEAFNKLKGGKKNENN